MAVWQWGCFGLLSDNEAVLDFYLTMKLFWTFIWQWGSFIWQWGWSGFYLTIRLFWTFIWQWGCFGLLSDNEAVLDFYLTMMLIWTFIWQWGCLGLLSDNEVVLDFYLTMRLFQLTPFSSLWWFFFPNIEYSWYFKCSTVFFPDVDPILWYTDDLAITTIDWLVFNAKAVFQQYPGVAIKLMLFLLLLQECLPSVDVVLIFF